MQFLPTFEFCGNYNFRGGNYQFSVISWFDVKISLNTQIWRGVVFPLFLKIKPYWTEKWILRFKSRKFSIDLGVIEPKLNTFWHQNKLKIDVANKVGSDLGVKYQNSVFNVSWRTVASKVGPC